jgi:hypothetical protein
MRRHLLSAGLALAVIAGACGDDGGGSGSGSGSGPDRAEVGTDVPTYEGTFTVLESSEHGPQLCSGVLLSYPPQCGGPDIVGWDWARVEGETTAGAVRWGLYQVTGTYADGRFTLTEPPGPAEIADPVDPGSFGPDFSPACDEPEVVDGAQGMTEWTSVGLDAPDVVTSWVTDPGPGGTGPFVANVVVLPGSGTATTDRIRQSYGGPLCVVERQAPTEAELASVQQELHDAEARAHLGQVPTSYPDGRLGAVVATVWAADASARDYARERWGDRVDLRSLLQPTA